MTWAWALLTVTVILLALELHISALELQWADDDAGPEKAWWE